MDSDFRESHGSGLCLEAFLGLSRSTLWALRPPAETLSSTGSGHRSKPMLSGKCSSMPVREKHERISTLHIDGPVVGPGPAVRLAGSEGTTEAQKPHHERMAGGNAQAR